MAETQELRILPMSNAIQLPSYIFIHSVVQSKQEPLYSFFGNVVLFQNIKNLSSKFAIKW